MVGLTEQCSVIMQNKLPPKLSGVTNPRTIGDKYFGKALCDLGASVNLMPLSLQEIGSGDS